MRVKPRISRDADGQWRVSRPPVGFRQLPDETTHDSWHDAVGSLVDICQHYAAGGQYERVRQHADAVATTPAWTPLDALRKLADAATGGSPGWDRRDRVDPSVLPIVDIRVT